MSKRNEKSIEQIREERKRPANDAPDKFSPSQRQCLRCGKNFLSEWMGNRMCGYCKSV